MADLLITGARVLTPQGLEDAGLRVEDGRIAEIGSPAGKGATHIDGRGLILAPAMVDIHGDAFERQVSPRPGVYAPPEVAVLDTDRQLAAAGIATAYHALTLSWEPGLRSVERGGIFLDALAEAEARCRVEHRVQLRWETFAFEAFALIEQALASALLPAIAFNDHTSMTLRAIDVPVTDREFEFSPDFEAAALDDDRLRQRTAGSAKRAGLSDEDYLDMLRKVWERRPDVPDAVRRVAEAGRARGAPMLSHDDSRIETREFYRGLGARIAEFPMCMETARDARARGESVVLGAPNAMRGGSHIGSLSAADMVEDGVCDVLASDYHYPAMLAAVGRMAAERRAPLERLWAVVSANPARALGLHDRGAIAEGARADLVLLDWPEGRTPAVLATISAGRLAYLGADLIG